MYLQVIVYYHALAIIIKSCSSTLQVIQIIILQQTAYSISLTHPQCLSSSTTSQTSASLLSSTSKVHPKDIHSSFPPVQSHHSNHHLLSLGWPQQQPTSCPPLLQPHESIHHWTVHNRVINSPWFAWDLLSFSIASPTSQEIPHSWAIQDSWSL